ncbi:hypothetical protein V6Z12_D09G162400 [Gossypium hirsutum]
MRAEGVEKRRRREKKRQILQHDPVIFLKLNHLLLHHFLSLSYKFKKSFSVPSYIWRGSGSHCHQAFRGSLQGMIRTPRIISR